MTKAALSLIFCLLLGCVFFAYLFRFLYYEVKRRRYRRAYQNDALYTRLKKVYKKARIPCFRNYLLYLILHTAQLRGEKEYAARLRPFLKPDFFCDFSDIDK